MFLSHPKLGWFTWGPVGWCAVRSDRADNLLRDHGPRGGSPEKSWWQGGASFLYDDPIPLLALPVGAQVCQHAYGQIQGGFRRNFYKEAKRLEANFE